MKTYCKVKMSERIRPVAGTGDGPHGSRTGTCPECNTPGVRLSIVGDYIRAHVVAETAIPENGHQEAISVVVSGGKKVGKGLSEPMVTLTDTGLRTGDPRAAEQRRVVEIEGVHGTGTVKIPVKGEKGRTKMEDAPATEDNVRKALAYWKARRPRTPEAHARQTSMIAEMFRRLDALTKSARTLEAHTTDVASVHRGPTLVRGRDTAPRVREPELPWDESTDLRRNGEVRKATTLDQPLGRERFDRKIMDVPEPKHKRSASERRRYRRALKAASSK